MSGKNNNHEILENLKPKITFLLGIPVLKGRMLSRISPHLNQEAMSFINNLKISLQNTAKITSSCQFPRVALFYSLGGTHVISDAGDTTEEIYFYLSRKT